MTTEEKAKAYDEALERASHVKGYKTLTPQEAAEYIFPQLHESEDEQTRKRLIDFISNIKAISESGRNSLAIRKDDAEICDAFLLYLEKQKEENHNGKKWIYEDDYHKDMERSFNDGKDEVLENPKKYGLQKEQKPIEDVVKDITANKESAIKFLKSAGIMDDNGELAEMYRSEQKSADYNYDNRIQYDSIKSGVEAFASTYSFNIESKLFSQLTKEQQQLWREEIEQAVVAGGENGIELARDNRYKENRMVEWSEEDKNELEIIIGLIEDDKADAVKQYPKCKALHNAYDRMLHFLKSLRPQSKVEWNDKDEEYLARIDRALVILETNSPHINTADDRKWLKSLRPSWKPSEEQMEALNTLLCVGDFSYVGQATKLQELYIELKKL